jgi:hypothetical protein
MVAQPLDWVNTSIAVLGLLGGAIGFLRAQSSNKKAAQAQARADDASVKAADAQADAASALKKNSEMTERIAVALEAMARSVRPGAAGRIETRGGPTVQQKSIGLEGPAAAISALANALAALTPSGDVRWSLEPREGAPDTYRLRNVGSADAKIVHVEGSPEGLSNLASIRGTDGSTVDEVLAGTSVVVGVSNRLALTVHEIKVWWSALGSDQPQQQVLELPD